MALVTPAFLIIAALGGHGAWTWQAEHKVERLVNGLRGKGEPVSLADFCPSEPVPDRHNAAVALRDAGELVDVGNDAWQAMFSLTSLELPLSGRELSVIRPAVKSNLPAITAVRAAMNKPVTDWAGVTPGTGNRGSLPPWGGRSAGLFRHRSLGQLLFVAALLAHQDADEVAALDHVDELLFYARATSKRPTARAQIAAQYLYDLAFTALDQIAPEFAIGDEPGAVTSDDVRRLLAELLNERQTRNAMVAALRAERARHIEALLPSAAAATLTTPALVSEDGGRSSPWADPLPLPPARSTLMQYLARPLALSNGQQAIERLGLAVESFDAPDLREFIACFPDDPPIRFDAAGEPVEEADSGYTRLLTSAIQQVGRGHYASLTRRRTTTLALAVCLYRAEHGQWPPADLAPLVPAYLPQIPADPFSTLGEPLIYVPDPQRPRIYSVGEDGIDDGGMPPDRFIARSDDSRSTDWVVDLVPQPRAERGDFHIR